MRSTGNETAGPQRDNGRRAVKRGGYNDVFVTAVAGKMARTDYRFMHPLRVRWAEVDRQGIVFNGHYLAYFDVGITEYWRAIGYPYPDGLSQHKTDLYVVKATVEYHTSAIYDDELDIGIRCARIGHSSMRFLPEIWRGDERIVSGELIYVNADPATKRPASVPEFLRRAIGEFERLPPEG